MFAYHKIFWFENMVTQKGDSKHKVPYLLFNRIFNRIILIIFNLFNIFEILCNNFNNYYQFTTKV